MSKAKIAVVFYCWAISDWKSRTTSAFERLKSSGLYDCADDLYFLVADTEGKKNEVESLAEKFPKFTLEYEPINLGSEYRAIKKVKEIGDGEGEHNILYFHAKGVYNKYSNVVERKELDELRINGINCWTEMLTYFVVDRWAECVDKLNDGFDTVGVACHNDWWWGNFWWASSRHVRKLRSLESNRDRWACEAWLHEARHGSEHDPIRFFEHNKFKYDPYFSVIPRYMYEKGNNSDVLINISKAEYGCFGEQVDECRSRPRNPNVIDVTEIVRETSLPNQIIYPKASLERLHSCDGEKCVRVYFSTSREPDANYVVTSYPFFDEIVFSTRAMGWRSRGG